VNRGGDRAAVLGVVKGDLLASFGGEVIAETAAIEHARNTGARRPQNCHLAFQVRCGVLDQQADQLGTEFADAPGAPIAAIARLMVSFECRELAQPLPRPRLAPSQKTHD
jgi:hypothetical protein